MGNGHVRAVALENGAMSIWDAVHELRRTLKLTQENFAHAIGVTVSAANRWERGHSKPSQLAARAMVHLAEERGLDLKKSAWGSFLIYYTSIGPRGASF